MSGENTVWSNPITLSVACILITRKKYVAYHSRRTAPNLFRLCVACPDVLGTVPGTIDADRQVREIRWALDRLLSSRGVHGRVEATQPINRFGLKD